MSSISSPKTIGLTTVRSVREDMVCMRPDASTVPGDDADQVRAGLALVLRSRISEDKRVLNDRRDIGVGDRLGHVTGELREQIGMHRVAAGAAVREGCPRPR